MVTAGAAVVSAGVCNLYASFNSFSPAGKLTSPLGRQVRAQMHAATTQQISLQYPGPLLPLASTLIARQRVVRCSIGEQPIVA